MKMASGTRNNIHEDALLQSIVWADEMAVGLINLRKECTSVRGWTRFDVAQWNLVVLNRKLGVVSGCVLSNIPFFHCSPPLLKVSENTLANSSASDHAVGLQLMWYWLKSTVFSDGDIYVTDLGWQANWEEIKSFFKQMCQKFSDSSVTICWVS